MLEKFTEKALKKADFSQKILFDAHFHYAECKKLGLELPFFDDGRIVKENYIPRCDGRNVMFWAQVSDYDGLGFNILLLESKDDIYGEWFVLESESNGLSRTNRPSPFGFSLSELPKEIVYLRTLHIYNMRLMPYEREKIIGFLAEDLTNLPPFMIESVYLCESAYFEE